MTDPRLVAMLYQTWLFSREFSFNSTHMEETPRLYVSIYLQYAYNIFSRISFYRTAEIVLGNCEYVIPKDGDNRTPSCKGMFEITELLIIFYICYKPWLRIVTFFSF